MLDGGRVEDILVRVQYHTAVLNLEDACFFICMYVYAYVYVKMTVCVQKTMYLCACEYMYM